MPCPSCQGISAAENPLIFKAQPNEKEAIASTGKNQFQEIETIENLKGNVTPALICQRRLFPGETLNVPGRPRNGPDHSGPPAA